jgi:hypothetical protein
MEFYSRKNDTMYFKGKWIQLEDIMVNEVNQAQKDKGCIFSLMWETDAKDIHKKA